MDEVARLLLLLALAGGALTLAGGGAVWFLDETRRIRRSLKKVLGGAPHAALTAAGRGRGVGFNFTTNQMAVCWDAGAWCLIYRVDELVGAELIVDGRVVARSHRGEARRALDVLSGAQDSVRLRFIFDDVANPDFDLDLWLAEDEDREGALSSGEATQEANRWIARVEALLRRPPGRREASAAPVLVAAAVAPIAPAAAAAPVAAADDDWNDDWNGGDDEDEDEDRAAPFA